MAKKAIGSRTWTAQDTQKYLAVTKRELTVIDVWARALTVTLAENISKEDNKGERLLSWEDAEKAYKSLVTEAQDNLMETVHKILGINMEIEISRWFLRNKYRSYHLTWTKDQKVKGKTGSEVSGEEEEKEETEQVARQLRGT